MLFINIFYCVSIGGGDGGSAADTHITYEWAENIWLEVVGCAWWFRLQFVLRAHKHTRAQAYTASMYYRLMYNKSDRCALVCLWMIWNEWNASTERSFVRSFVPHLIWLSACLPLYEWKLKYIYIHMYSFVMYCYVCCYAASATTVWLCSSECEPF